MKLVLRLGVLLTCLTASAVSMAGDRIYHQKVPRGPAEDPGSGRSILATGTLTLTKSGGDVILSWTGTGTTYEGARSTDPQFTATTTLFLGNTATTHVYEGAVSNARTLEFFDVTDETESNRGGNWNGGALPPLPPAIDSGNPITTIGDLYIGSAGVIAGSGFSSIPTVNTICFQGGVCTQATVATPSQVGFVTPPGAYSGPVTVTVGGQTSEPGTAVVALVDPADWSNVRELTYSEQDRSYWVLGFVSGVFSVYRLYFDTGTQEWNHDSIGTGGIGLGVCSSQTSRTGRILCRGDVVNSTGEVDVAVIDTSPPTAPTHCVTIDLEASPSPLLVFMPSAAMDPNPDGLRADAGYVTVVEQDTGITLYRILKVANDCSAIVDDNYGNFVADDGARNNSMVVDPTNGDLYFAIDGEIRRITTSESVSVVRSGLPAATRIESLTRESANDPGTLLLNADGAIEALALDNIAADPVEVATVGNGFYPAVFGAQVSGGPWDAANVNRTVTVYRDGSSLILEDHPLIDVTLKGPFQIRISSPDTDEPLSGGQSSVRESDPDDMGFSTAIARLRYNDGVARNTCAKIGDPGPGAPQYDPSPSVPTNCYKPRDDASGPCDNLDDIAANGPFSFVGGGFTSCKTCGGSTPCTFEFRITNQYAGDNYAVYFAGDQTAERFFATSGIYSAWKHIHVEQERMFRQGGLLSQSFDPTTCGATCDEITVWDWVNIDPGNVTIAVFDAATTYDGAEERVVMSSKDNLDGTITLKLDADLTQQYIASPYPDFDSGLSAGIGQVQDAAAALCDPCFFELDLSGLPHAFDDGLTSYHITDYGLVGSGTVPFVPQFDFSTDATFIGSTRFHQVWFAQKDPTECMAPGGTLCADCCNAPQNYFHAMGLRRMHNSNVGFTAAASDVSWTWVVASETACMPCTTDDLGKFIRNVGVHESGHQFSVNLGAVNQHDDNTAWCGMCGGATPELCVMNTETDTLPDRIDGIDRFDCFNLIQNIDFCSNTTELGEGIRVTDDPK